MTRPPAKALPRFCRAKKGGVPCGRPWHPPEESHRAEVPVDEQNPDAGTKVISWRE